jgi:hypothetical protein
MMNLKEMLIKYGNVEVKCMNEEKGWYRIYKDNELGNRLNWKKVKEILSKNNIEFGDGNNGYNRCIDVYFKL